MIWLTLLTSFLHIGFFSIGGGYATIPLIKEQVVDFHHWLTIQEFTDIITISQMTPGLWQSTPPRLPACVSWESPVPCWPHSDVRYPAL